MKVDEARVAAAYFQHISSVTQEGDLKCGGFCDFH